MTNLTSTILCAVLASASLTADTTINNQTASPVRMTVTANIQKDKRAPEITKADVSVNKGKQRLEVLDWTPAKGDQAGLELFFLIDDSSSWRIGGQLQELRDFINTQAPATAIGVGYARNGTVEIVQNFTADHELAAKALRLPLGYAGAYGSPYLSVTDLIKHWPETANRREVVLISDGIDRAHRGRNALTNPDVDTAARAAQRTGSTIHTIYFPGVGHARHNYFVATYGQNGLAKLSDLTGGETFSLLLHTPVSFAPYLGELERVLDNQYILTVAARPGRKASLQNITVKTEVAGVDFSTPDAVWVPAAK